MQETLDAIIGKNQSTNQEKQNNTTHIFHH